MKDRSMRSKLLNWLPGMRWVPHDIPEASTTARSNSHTSSSKSSSRNHNHRVRFTLKEKDKTKPQKDGANDHDPRFPSHRRKSTISIGSIPDEELDARTNVQAQSLLFAKCPIEVRKMVYEYVMGGETVHLTLGAKRRYGHFLCEESWREGGGEEEEEEEDVVDCKCRVLVGGKESRRLDGTGVNLLRVCRRIYTEAVPHLYKPHTFALLHITHLLYLPTRLPSARLSTIRSLRLRWAIRALPFLSRKNSLASSIRYTYPEDTANWLRAWKILADMQKLRDLVVIISDPSPNEIWEASWLSLEGKLLEAVKEVKVGGGGRNGWFELWLPYASCRTDWDMGDCKVVLRKPEGEGEEDDEEE